MATVWVRIVILTVRITLSVCPFNRMAHTVNTGQPRVNENELECYKNIGHDLPVPGAKPTRRSRTHRPQQRSIDLKEHCPRDTSDRCPHQSCRKHGISTRFQKSLVQEPKRRHLP
jgi:hypothetical protein